MTVTTQPEIIRDESYHKSAVKYNVELAEFAAKLADETEHPLVSRWCRGVSKQHAHHARAHQKALDRLTSRSQGELALDISETSDGE